MKRIRRPISKELQLVKLYLDDLQQIYEVLKEKGKNIKIIAEDYEIEDVNELSKLGIKKLHNLSIKCSDPYITIELDTMWARIYFSEDTTYNRGILSEIEDVIRKRSNILSRSLASWWGYACTLVLFSCFSVSTIVNMKNDITMIFGWISLALLLLSIIALITSFRYKLMRYSTIMLYAKKEESSFWRRNKDQILVAIIAAIAGSVITAFVLLVSKLI